MIKHTLVWWIQKISAILIIATLLLSNIYPKFFIISIIFVSIHILIGTDSILKDYVHDSHVSAILYTGVFFSMLYMIHLVYILY